MNIEFTSAHMETLMELKQPAEKHDCKITFGVDSWTGVDPEFDKFVDYTDKIKKELNDKGYFSDGIVNMTKFWFRFYVPNNMKRHYHYLEYSEGEQTVTYHPYSYEEFSEEAEAFLEENKAAWDDSISPYDNTALYTQLGETNVEGFEGLERPGVYREGMTLKFFGDLVCDYLREERIVRSY